MNYEHLSPTNTPLVQINWMDIVQGDNYNEDDEVQGIEVSTIGWLLADTPQEVVIASTYVWREERWSDQHAFPKAEPEVVVIKDNAPAIDRELVDICPMTGESESDIKRSPDD